jgi:hypothetical protein
LLMRRRNEASPEQIFELVVDIANRKTRIIVVVDITSVISYSVSFYCTTVMIHIPFLV